MGELGKVKPYTVTPLHSEEKATEWRVPILVLSDEGEKSYKIKAIYEDEGYLCIDIEVPASTTE